jgi:hypothetical protein
MREVVKNRNVVDPRSARPLGEERGIAEGGDKPKPLTVAEVLSMAVVSFLALMGLGPVLLMLAVV